MVDDLFRALADPTRRGMVERLSRGPASVTDLARPYMMSMPALLQHLSVLEAGGIVRSEKVGRVRICRLEIVALRAVEDWASARLADWQQRLDGLASYLGEADEADRD